jgi:hypothetical protein
VLGKETGLGLIRTTYGRVGRRDNNREGHVVKV